MDCTLHLGDRVRSKDGREGVIDGVYADGVALVGWDQGPPSYEALAGLSKAPPLKPERPSRTKPAHKV